MNVSIEVQSSSAKTTPSRCTPTDANLRGTAFGPVNAQLHQVNIAVTLGDAGTAIDLARQINPAAITVTERKASLLIDVAQAFFQSGKYGQAYTARSRTAGRLSPALAGLDVITGRVPWQPSWHLGFSDSSNVIRTSLAGLMVWATPA